MHPPHLKPDEVTVRRLDLLTEQFKGDIREVRKNLLGKIEYHTTAKHNALEMLNLLDRMYIL